MDNERGREAKSVVKNEYEGQMGEERREVYYVNGETKGGDEEI